MDRLIISIRFFNVSPILDTRSHARTVRETERQRAEIAGDRVRAAHCIDDRGQLNANYLIPRIGRMYSVHTAAIRTQYVRRSNIQMIIV